MSNGVLECDSGMALLQIYLGDNLVRIIVFKFRFVKQRLATTERQLFCGRVKKRVIEREREQKLMF